MDDPNEITPTTDFILNVLDGRDKKYVLCIMEDGKTRTFMPPVMTPQESLWCLYCIDEAIKGAIG